MIKRKPKPSELSKESLSLNKELTLRIGLSRVLCKPMYAALKGNVFCGERYIKTRTTILVGD